MEYHEEFIIDFANRTRANLEFIESSEAKGFSVYEVTQLCNSLLGLLVFPREQYMSSIPNTALSELVAKGWPSVKTTQGKLKQDTLRGLIDYLRHGVSHCNVEFLPGADKQIEGLRIWNHENGKRHLPKSWEAELSIADLRAIALKFIELIEESRAS